MLWRRPMRPTSDICMFGGGGGGGGGSPTPQARALANGPTYISTRLTTITTATTTAQATGSTTNPATTPAPSTSSFVAEAKGLRLHPGSRSREEAPQHTGDDREPDPGEQPESQGPIEREPGNGKQTQHQQLDEERHHVVDVDVHRLAHRAGCLGGSGKNIEVRAAYSG